MGGCERREESTTRWFRFRIGPFWPSGNRALACSIAKRETLDPTSPGACGNQVTEMSDFDGLLRRYYENPTIRERMCEFLGGAEPWNASAAYLVGTDGVADYTRPSSTKRLPEYLEAGLEVDRSLWDRDLMIVDIDLEYHNFDNPAIPWLDPERAFVLQKPVLDISLRILAEAGIVPLTLMSGRGYHLVWSIRRSTRAFCRLVKLGRIPPSLKARYQHAFFPGGATVELSLGRAFAGLGMMMEFIGHRVLTASQESCTIPVQPAAIEVGPGSNGREIVSFDLSEYGDPLHTRHIRLPFSAYQKPRQMQWALGEEGVRRLMPIFEIPLTGMTQAEAIATARDPEAVVELSCHASAEIPEASAAMETLIDEYENSELAAFHQQFYGEPCQQPPYSVDAGSVRIAGAPRCVEWLLDHPNDWLLKPAALQHVARVLTALEWPPLAIAHLICRSYHTDADWGDFWTRLDPCNRAIFYTRLFTGMIATGVDELVDLNCVSHREKGYCVTPDCSSNLVQFRDALLKRKSNERLGGRPIDGLLLADQHL